MSTLKSISTEAPADWDKKKIEKATDKLLDQIYEYGKKIVAGKQKSILLVLQGMDASGKDGLTRTLFQKLSPAWVTVHSFKKPSELEAAHDFLWRIHQRVPEKGMITVFNRSHYEDILVPSVYKYIDSDTIEKRYDLINDFETMLEANGTKVIKMYLHLSKEKQEIKLMERINTLEKHWKHSDGDWETRKYWDEFMEVYESILTKCNTIPWHIVPCDKNWVKLYAAATILVETMAAMNLEYPALESEQFKPDYGKGKISY